LIAVLNLFLPVHWMQFQWHNGIKLYLLIGVRVLSHMK
jgi:hypothetical protein